MNNKIIKKQGQGLTPFNAPKKDNSTPLSTSDDLGASLEKLKSTTITTTKAPGSSSTAPSSSAPSSTTKPSAYRPHHIEAVKKMQNTMYKLYDAITNLDVGKNDDPKKSNHKVRDFIINTNSTTADGSSPMTNLQAHMQNVGHKGKQVDGIWGQGTNNALKSLLSVMGAIVSFYDSINPQTYNTGTEYIAKFRETIPNTHPTNSKDIATKANELTTILEKGIVAVDRIKNKYIANNNKLEKYVINNEAFDIVYKQHPISNIDSEIMNIGLLSETWKPATEPYVNPTLTDLKDIESFDNFLVKAFGDRFSKARDERKKNTRVSALTDLEKLIENRISQVNKAQQEAGTSLV